MKEFRRLIFLLGALLFFQACQPDMDKKAFERLEQTAVSLNASLHAGMTYDQFEEGLHRFSAEITTIENRAKSRKDREMVKAFADLLTIYRDGLTLWRYKLEFTPFDFVPKGRIYVGQDVEPIVSKYNLTTETHLYEPTEKHWRSVSEESIGFIWGNADSQLQIIKNLLRG